MIAEQVRWGCWQCNRYGWCYLDKWCPPERKEANAKTQVRNTNEL